MHNSFQEADHVVKLIVLLRRELIDFSLKCSNPQPVKKVFPGIVSVIIKKPCVLLIELWEFPVNSSERLPEVTLASHLICYFIALRPTENEGRFVLLPGKKGSTNLLNILFPSGTPYANCE